MKLNKKTLSKIIFEVLEDAPTGTSPAETEKTPPPRPETAREKTVKRGMEMGATMPPEQYANTARAALLTTKVTTQNRLKALESIFPGKGTIMNTIILAALKAEAAQKRGVQPQKKPSLAAKAGSALKGLGKKFGGLFKEEELMEMIQEEYMEVLREQGE